MGGAFVAYKKWHIITPPTPGVALSRSPINRKRNQSSDRCFSQKAQVYSGMDSTSKWLDCFSIFSLKSLLPVRGRIKEIYNVQGIGMLLPGAYKSTANWDTNGKDEPGKAYCLCPRCQGDKSFVWLTWIAGKSRKCISCFYNHFQITGSVLKQHHWMIFFL